ncbi:hypothetical protein M0804_013292 [Polistes exclamans]|nr:hypothetical protein M0804_013292 [Polistes exclamans]
MSKTNVELKEILRHVDKYHPSDGKFLEWLNKVDYVLNKLNIENDIKRTYIIFNLVDSSIFVRIKTLVTPVNAFHISYDLIVSLLESKLTNYGKYHAVKYRLSVRDQFPDESVINYFFAIKNLNDQIMFGPQANVKLLSRFKQGLKCQEIREVLNTFSNLKVSAAVLIAMKMESERNPPTDVSSEEKNLKLLNQLEEEEKRLKNQAINV